LRTVRALDRASIGTGDLLNKYPQNVQRERLHQDRGKLGQYSDRIRTGRPGFDSR